MLLAQEAMSSVQLPPPLTIRSIMDVLYNDVLSLTRSKSSNGRQMKSTVQWHQESYKPYKTYYDTLMAPMWHWLNEVVKCQSSFRSLTGTTNLRSQASKRTNGLTFVECSSCTFPKPFWNPSLTILEQIKVVRSKKFDGKLAHSLASYADLLLTKRKKMQVVH